MLSFVDFQLFGFERHLVDKGRVPAQTKDFLLPGKNSWLTRTTDYR